MAKKTTAVIGAGPAGITAAYELTKKGVKVDLYEASPYVGGMARSFKLWGQIVDIGPHRFFSSDTRVNKLWLEVIGNDYAMVDRLTRIFYRNKFYYYPVKAGNALKNLGPIEALRSISSYGLQRVKPGGKELGDTFESWVIANFGKRLYGHFFKTYTEKLWGIPGNELDSEFASQRIKKLSMGEVIKSSIFGGGGEKHKTLVDQFAYPNKGTGEVYERMKKYIEKNGGKVHLQTPVDSLLTRGKTVTGVKLVDGPSLKYDHVVSSMPLTVLVGRLKDVPPKIAKANKTLRFRNTLIVYLKVDAKEIFPDNWIYVHSKELRTGRITNFRNWVPSINQGKKESIIAMEYWSFNEDDFWSWDEAKHIALAKKELAMTGLVQPEEIHEGKVIRVPRCYPVYGRGYKKDLKLVEDFLRQYKNLGIIGRYGAFKYNNQDHSILMGMLAAENIADGAKHDLWDINSDDEYQESSVITKTGLKEK